MKRCAFAWSVVFCLVTLPAWASTPSDIDALRQELDALKAEYHRKISDLEERLREAERKLAQEKAATPPTPPPSSPQRSARSYNPAIGLVLDGRYSAFSANPEEYALPGFQLGGEAGPGEEGFSAQHSELTVSANADDLFYGSLTAAIASHEGATELELEEAYIETPALGHGLVLRGGRFLSGIGYLNQQHAHAWDFADAPLIYAALFGDQLNDEGVQLSWVAPTETYLNLGLEWLRGNDWPAAGSADDGTGAGTLFLRIGGDIGFNSSWQLGISHWLADVRDRASAAGTHGHDAGQVLFSGDSRISGVDFVWKWLPGGNLSRKAFKFQSEFFFRREDGELRITHDPVETSHFDGHQYGGYAQMVYQFMPRWRLGLRYDRLVANNRAASLEMLREAGLDAEGHRPERAGIMLDYSHSEFSRIRLQYNRDRSRPSTDHQLFLQYILSLGAHGAHAF